MRVGIVPVITGFGGGVYQYSLTMLHALHDWKCDGSEDEFIVFSDHTHDPALVPLNGRHWTVKPIQPPSPQKQALDGLRRIVGEGPHREAWRWLRGQLWGNVRSLNPDVVKHQLEANRWFSSCGVELMIYPDSNPLSFEAGIPYIMAVHDLQHRLQPK